ncbi:MAG: 16S rRNA (cytosine(967)-C(5))-methyltransferase RsmB [Eubacterium sp.]|nr:16S rRNA (cytosine(967)-C(5))-methyltransferase RsmB [Eubacterium sp.]
MRECDPRSLALDTLLAVEKEQRPGHLVMRDVLASHPELDPRDVRFYRKLVEGCLENFIRLDYIIDQFAKTKTGRMKPVVREILRMAVYQIFELDSVPDSAAVNEAVRLASRRGLGNLRGFVNGVLRNIIRGREEITWPDRETDPTRYLSIMYSVPAHLVERWRGQLGTARTEIICGAFQEEPPLTVRLRGIQSGKCASADEAEALLADQLTGTVTAEPAPYVPFARILKGVADLEKLPAFQNGLIAVQDVSSMLAVLAAGIRPGDTVLDLAAAPGGKSLLAADLLQGSGHVISRDISERKTALITENAERLGIQNIEIQVHDAAEFDPSMEGRADVVLADLPCSGLGVIGRKPDIRYHVSDEKTESLAQLQRKILLNAVRYCRPGGTLLYSTCTFDPRENEENAAWLEEHTDARPDPVAPFLPAALAAEAGDGCSLQLYPGVHQCDGFFIARFKV